MYQPGPWEETDGRHKMVPSEEIVTKGQQTRCGQNTVKAQEMVFLPTVMNCPSLPEAEGFAGLECKYLGQSRTSQDGWSSISASSVPTPRPEGTRGRSSYRSLVGGDGAGTVAERCCPPMATLNEGAQGFHLPPGSQKLPEHRSLLMKATQPGHGSKETQTRMEC